MAINPTQKTKYFYTRGSKTALTPGAVYGMISNGGWESDNPNVPVILSGARLIGFCDRAAQNAMFWIMLVCCPQGMVGTMQSDLAIAAANIDANVKTFLAKYSDFIWAQQKTCIGVYNESQNFVFELNTSVPKKIGINDAFGVIVAMQDMGNSVVSGYFNWDLEVDISPVTSAVTFA